MSGLFSVAVLVIGNSSPHILDSSANICLKQFPANSIACHSVPFSYLCTEIIAILMEPSDTQNIESLKVHVAKAFGRTLDSPSDYDSLSLSIREKTGEYISPTTLKRLFGYVKPATVPRPSTLSVLSRYVGYAGWSDFCQSLEVLNPDSAGPELEPEADLTIRTEAPESGFPAQKTGSEPAKILSNDRRRKSVVVLSVSAAVICCAVAAILIFGSKPKAGSSTFPGTAAPETVFPESGISKEISDTARIKEAILMKCMDVTIRGCADITSRYGKMDIVAYRKYIDSRYCSFVFTDLRNMVRKEVAAAFGGSEYADMTANEIFSRCRDYCVEKIYLDFPNDEYIEALNKM